MARWVEGKIEIVEKVKSAESVEREEKEEGSYSAEACGKKEVEERRGSLTSDSDSYCDSS